jgi:hypothetical protein
VDDESRLLLELAHDTIGTLILRLASNAKVLEVVEAELAARNSPLFDDDPGLGL